MNTSYFDSNAETVYTEYERLWSAASTADSGTPDLAAFISDSKIPLSQQTLTELLCIDVERRLLRSENVTPTLYTFLNMSTADVQSAIDQVRKQHQTAMIAGRFILEAELGQGAFGRVYSAQDCNSTSLIDRRPVALKIARIEYADVANHSFRREAEVAARINHQNIVKVLDTGTDELKRAWLSMERVNGLPLSKIDVVASESLKPKERLQRVVVVTELLHGIASAIAHAHEGDLVHGDLTPPNVLVDDRGHAFVLDFGLSCSVSTNGRPLSDSNGGTLDRESNDEKSWLARFLAPEVRSRADATRASDVYSIGTVGRWLLGGQASRQAVSPGTMRLPTHSARTKPHPCLAYIVSAVCKKAQHDDPQRRYSSAEELRDDLACCLAGTEPTCLRGVPRFLCWLRRHLWPVLSAGFLFVLFVIVLWIISDSRARTQRAKLLGLIDEGKWRVEQHDRIGGVALFQKVLDLSPPDDVAAEAHYQLANSLPTLAATSDELQRLRNEAFAHYGHAIRKNPHHRLARLNLGVLYHDSGRYVEAINAYLDLLREVPDYAPAYNNIGVTLGVQPGRNGIEPLRVRGQKLATPLSAFKHAVHLDPEYRQAYVNLGNELFNMRRYQEAASHYEKAIQIDRGQWDAWSALGNCYRKLRDSEKAVGAFREALRLADKEASAARPLYLSALLPMPNEDRIARLRIAGELRWSDPDFRFEIARSAAEFAQKCDNIDSLVAHELSNSLKPLAIEQLKQAIKRMTDTNPGAVPRFKQKIANDQYLRVLNGVSGFTELLQ